MNVPVRDAPRARTAAIVGSGVLGQSWAVSFLRGGWNVELYDRDDAAITRARAVIDERLASIDRATGSTERLGQIREQRRLESALSSASYVQESTRERIAVKTEVFAELDQLAPPDCILASSTSSLRATDFTAGLHRRERCIVVHPLNPPHLLPAVEVIPSRWTSGDTTETTLAIMAEIGQAPLVVQVEGEFPLTRLQAAILDESIRLVYEGVLSPDDVDTAVREGLGLRWALSGPFETVDLNAAGGFAAFMTEYGPMFQKLLSAKRSSDPAWSSDAIARIEASRRASVPVGGLPELSRRRDARLLALASHVRLTRSSHPPTTDEERL